MSIIKFQKKEDMVFTDLGNGISRAEMLPGMVDGVHTWKCQIKAGTVVTLEPLQIRHRFITLQKAKAL